MNIEDLKKQEQALSLAADSSVMHEDEFKQPKAAGE